MRVVPMDEGGVRPPEAGVTCGCGPPNSGVCGAGGNEPGSSGRAVLTLNHQTISPTRLSLSRVAFHCDFSYLYFLHFFSLTRGFVDFADILKDEFCCLLLL